MRPRHSRLRNSKYITHGKPAVWGPLPRKYNGEIDWKAVHRVPHWKIKRFNGVPFLRYVRGEARVLAYD